ncbi:unnamed protein product [Macrosiphum euphorbiae]|uniref:Uncharacterized protein n=1 Tax=Macrosiphum euphorbiae TaxID=13131 RepID=A0AAV0W168_9HEMI|nr:unnamed protein product [Macrosiphum euphorbiae]
MLLRIYEIYDSRNQQFRLQNHSVKSEIWLPTSRSRRNSIAVFEHIRPRLSFSTYHKRYDFTYRRTVSWSKNGGRGANVSIGASTLPQWYFNFKTAMDSERTADREAVRILIGETQL